MTYTNRIITELTEDNAPVYTVKVSARYAEKNDGTKVKMDSYLVTVDGFVVGTVRPVETFVAAALGYKTVGWVSANLQLNRHGHEVSFVADGWGTSASTRKEAVRHLLNGLARDNGEFGGTQLAEAADDRLYVRSAVFNEARATATFFAY